MSKWVAIDVETTGLSPVKGDRVIEVGAVAVSNGNIVAEFGTLISVAKTISFQAQNVHGISDTMLRGRPPPEDVFREFRKFIGRSMLVAHNARFDMGFLRREFSRLGLSLSNCHICTLKASRRLVPGLPNYRLATVARRLLGAQAGGQRHRALDDARLVAHVWMHLDGK